MVSTRSVLVVEDDPQVASTIVGALEREGWLAETVMSLAEARQRLETMVPQIVVVDLGLPDGSGMLLVREASARRDLGILDLGIIVVTARSEEMDRVLGLEIGADDYITKPFSMREVTARVRALSRRMDGRSAAPAEPPPPAQGAAASWQLGGVLLDTLRMKVVGADGAETRLTGAEAGLLKLMLEAPDRTVERDAIAEHVLGHRLLPHQRGVDQLASTLRRKLAVASAQRIQVLALRGRGYRLVA